MLMRTLSLVLFSLLPLPALAVTITPPSGTAWDFYVIAGNVPVIAALMESVKSMTSPSTNPEFRTLVATFATIGFFAVVFSSVRGAPERIGKYIIAIWLLTYALFSLEMDIVVTDNTNSATVLVQEVPAAIGFPAAAVGTIGNWLTEKTELHFSLPNYDNLKLSQGAFLNMNASMLEALSRVQITNPYIKESFAFYMQDCIIPAVVSGKVDPAILLKSGNLWKELAGAQHQSLYTNWRSLDGTKNFGTCEEAYAGIDGTLTTYTPKLLSSLGERFSFIDATGAGGTYLKAALDSSLQWSSAAGGTADTAALQQGVISAFRGSYRQAAAALGADDMLLSMNLEQAKAAQRTGWYTTAELFREAVVNMYAVMQAFIIGLAPIVMAAAVLPKIGMALMKGWAEVLVWLALWAPAFALINFLMAVREQTAMKQITQNGITLMSDTALNEAAVNFIMQSNLMMTMVPAILWGLVKGGSMAMTSVMERASGASQAGSAAQKSAEGSFSAGNVSMNNMSANHHDLTQSRSYGAQPTQLHNGNAATTELDHLSLSTAARGGQAITEKFKSQDTTQRAAEVATAKQNVQDAFNERSHAISQLADFSFAKHKEAVTSEAAQKGITLEESEADALARARTMDTVFAAMIKAGENKETATEVSYRAGLSAGKGGEGGELPGKGKAGKGDEEGFLNGLASLAKKIGNPAGTLMKLAGAGADMSLKKSDGEKATMASDVSKAFNAKQGTGRNETATETYKEGNSTTLSAQDSDKASLDYAMSNSQQYQEVVKAGEKYTAAVQALEKLSATQLDSRELTDGVGVHRSRLQGPGSHNQRTEQAINDTTAAVAAGQLQVEKVVNDGLANADTKLKDGKQAVTDAQAITAEQASALLASVGGEIDKLSPQEREMVMRYQNADADLAATHKANEGLAESAKKVLKQEDSQADLKTLAEAGFYSVYGATSLLGPIAGTFGGAAVGGVMAAETLINGTNLRDDMKHLVANLGEGNDLKNADGQVIGQMIGMHRDAEGNMTPVYRYQTEDGNYYHGRYNEGDGTFSKLGYDPNSHGELMFNDSEHDRAVAARDHGEIADNAARVASMNPNSPALPQVEETRDTHAAEEAYNRRGGENQPTQKSKEK